VVGVHGVWDAGRGTFSFRTQGMEGVLAADGVRHGVLQLTERQSGFSVTGGPLLAVYRLLARGAWMGEAREMPHRVEGLPDGLRLTWPPRLVHQVHLTATFRVVEAAGVDALDLELDAVGHAAYDGYEVFVSNYFAPGLRTGAYVRAVAGEPSDEGLVRVEPLAHPAFRGMYLAFPRDDAASALYTDGRWQAGRHRTRFAPLRPWGLPVAVARFPEPGVDVLIMGLPEDVAGVCMAYAAPPGEDDEVAAHRSLYLSCWGRDLRPGIRWRTVVRLAVGRWHGDPRAHREAWSLFLAAYRDYPRTAEVPAEALSPLWERAPGGPVA
jgi:hypothetical protein